MPYTPQKSIDRQMAMSQALANQVGQKQFGKANKISDFMRALGAAGGRRSAGRKERENQEITAKERALLSQILSDQSQGVGTADQGVGPLKPGGMPAFQSPVGDQALQHQMAMALEGKRKERARQGATPSSIQTYEYMRDLPTDQDRQNMLLSMRGQRMLDTGGGYSPNPMDRWGGGQTPAPGGAAPGGPQPVQQPQPALPSVAKTLAPEKELDYIEKAGEAKITGEETARRDQEIITKKPFEEKNLENKQRQFTLLDTTIGTALDQANGWTTGFSGTVLGAIPGTDAYDLGKTLDTVRANIGFDKLQQMREASPTGGALGQVSERENILLQSVWGSVEQSQSEPQLRKNLEALRKTLNEIIHGQQASFDKQYPELPGDFGEAQRKSDIRSRALEILNAK